jgi:mono/diheme cytochrome c family protein
MQNRLAIFLACLVGVVAACGTDSEPQPQVDPDAPEQAQWMMRHTSDYLDDAQWRRAELEDSLWMPELPYARKRLSSYGFGDRGWDLLPRIDARVEPVNPGTQLDSPFEGRTLTPDQTPQSYEAWLELGEDVFWSMPMRRDAYLEWIAQRPELWDDVGLQTNEDGSLRGVVRFRDARGDVRMAATCGLCHGDEGIAGSASDQLKLGKGRDLFAQSRGGEPTEYAEWPAGTVDVTDDGVTDPLSIPDLWGAEHLDYLNASGAVRATSPASLAVRFETQYIVGHSMEARPDRRLTWALAMYVMSLEPASDGAQTDETGRALFDQHCAGCHRPDNGFSGGLVVADTITSDPQAANSAFRGTGSYRVPSLLGISGGAPYLHDASEPSLRALLDGGHPGEVDLSDSDKTRLIRFLDSI